MSCKSTLQYHCVKYRCLKTTVGLLYVADALWIYYSLLYTIQIIGNK